MTKFEDIGMGKYSNTDFVALAIFLFFFSITPLASASTGQVAVVSLNPDGSVYVDHATFCLESGSYNECKYSEHASVALFDNVPCGSGVTAYITIESEEYPKQGAVRYF